LRIDDPVSVGQQLVDVLQRPDPREVTVRNSGSRYSRARRAMSFVHRAGY
jgi:hypothetical protein